VLEVEHVRRDLEVSVAVHDYDGEVVVGGEYGGEKVGDPHSSMSPRACKFALGGEGLLSMGVFGRQILIGCAPVST
jgi:hypothetical protein